MSIFCTPFLVWLSMSESLKNTGAQWCQRLSAVALSISQFHQILHRFLSFNKENSSKKSIPNCKDVNLTSKKFEPHCCLVSCVFYLTQKKKVSASFPPFSTSLLCFHFISCQIILDADINHNFFCRLSRLGSSDL